MNNLILSITRNVIPYVKELREIAGSVTACILMQQLDYWFSKKSDGFYKFIEPCQHPSYVVGDSWSEELGFSSDEYRSAYEKIGIRYKSKGEFLKSEDKFQNKFYACYHDRGKNQTFYIRNHELVDVVLHRLIDSTKHRTPQEKNCKKQDRNNSSINKDYPVMVTGKPPVTVTEFSQVIRTPISHDTELEKLDLHNSRKSISLYRTDTTTDNSLSLSSSEFSLEREMIDIWNKIIEEGNKTLNLTPERQRNLSKLFSSEFHQNMEEWESFCKQIASSKFLMGEVTPFKASIDWVLKPETTNKIKEKDYGIGDRILKEKDSESQSESQKLQDCLLHIYESNDSSAQFKKFQELVLNHIGASAYRRWFKDTREGEGGREDLIVIQTPNRFVSDNIEKNFLEDMKKIAIETYGNEMNIKFLCQS